jgi:hypothetical protein
MAINKPGVLPIATICCAAMAACTALPGPTPATSAQANGRQCFLASEVSGFSPATNGDFVDVSVGANRWFRLTLGGGCPNINWSTRVGIRSTSGSPWVCEGYDAEFVVPDPSFPQRCPVSAVRPLTPAEIQQAIHRK